MAITADLEHTGAAFLSQLFDFLPLQSAFALSAANKRFLSIFNAKSHLPLVSRYPLYLLSPAPLSQVLRCLHSQLQALKGLHPHSFPITSQEFSEVFHSLESKGRCLHFTYASEGVLVWKVDLKYERVERVAVMQGIEEAVAWSGAGKRYVIASSDRLLAGKFSLKAINTEGIYSRKTVITALPAQFLPSQLLFINSGQSILIGGISQVLVLASHSGHLQATIQLEGCTPPMLKSAPEDSRYWAIASNGSSAVRLYFTDIELTQLIWERSGCKVQQYRELFLITLGRDNVKAVAWYQSGHVEYDGRLLTQSVQAAAAYRAYFMVMTDDRAFHLYDLSTSSVAIQSFRPCLPALLTPPVLFLSSTHFHLSHSSYLLSLEYTGLTPFATLALPMRDITAVHFLPSYALIHGRVAGSRKTLAIAPFSTFAKRKKTYEELIHALESTGKQVAISELKRIKKIDELAKINRARKKADKSVCAIFKPKRRVKSRKHREIDIDWWNFYL